MHLSVFENEESQTVLAICTILELDILNTEDIRYSILRTHQVPTST